ncbi:hypothetical protein M011DRAFT_221214 [Sporormia fimetaria CBS 119925]|uniref:Uncharacterized protein n=1 Tax=Sporormia fimetaria CBS 119925 TaxID=1340428 RepID=A0A6A6V289_9PLEO|nr:hypothetical protein M011DRAFT_221214 [Sporormia fimetaria CBS 119925]
MVRVALPLFSTPTRGRACVALEPPSFLCPLPHPIPILIPPFSSPSSAKSTFLPHAHSQPQHLILSLQVRHLLLPGTADCHLHLPQSATVCHLHDTRRRAYPPASAPCDTYMAARAS